MFNEKIKPSLVLTLICLIACALLVAAYEATNDDGNIGEITEKMTAGLNEIYGTADGFEMKLDENGKVYAPEGVTSVLEDANGNTAFEIITDGYSGGGIHVMVGISSDGAVTGVSVLTLGETPGVGTKVKEASFLGQFKGLTFDKLPKTGGEESSTKKKYVWGSEEEINSLKEAASAVPAGDTFELDAITGATLSSNGMNRAVTAALNAYNEMKGVSGNE